MLEPDSLWVQGRLGYLYRADPQVKDLPQALAHLEAGLKLAPAHEMFRDLAEQYFAVIMPIVLVACAAWIGALLQWPQALASLVTRFELTGMWLLLMVNLLFVVAGTVTVVVALTTVTPGVVDVSVTVQEPVPPEVVQLEGFAVRTAASVEERISVPKETRADVGSVSAVLAPTVIGNLTGALLGGMFLGMVESFAGAYLGTYTRGAFGAEYKDMVAFLILILFRYSTKETIPPLY